MFPVYWSYYQRAFKIVKSEPAVIYHAHDLNTLLVAFWASRRHGAGLVYDSHELFIETSTLPEVQKKVWKIVERLLIHRAHKVITVNGSIAEELSTRYNILLPMVVMNAPNLSSRPGFRRGKNLLRQRLELDKEVPIILYQGGYTPNRGLENLILAAHSIEKGIIVFMGWGRLEDTLRQLVISEKLDERVKFTDPVPPELLLKYTQCADLGVIPYQFVGLNNYYTTPNKLFEYMMAGLPVIGSDFPELRRIIIEYGLGQVFDPDDPKDIAKKISVILSDPANLKRYKQNGRKAANIFNWENESKKLISAYSDIKRSK
jgi:glycosyltransferase involved in cell wall biosynthesis